MTVSIFFFAGCGGSAATSDPALSDAGSDGDAARVPTENDAGSDTSTTCSEIVNDAPEVVAHLVGTAPPVATGGTISDGTYHLTDLSAFTGPNGASGPLELKLRSTISVHGSTIDIVQDANGKHEWATETFVASSNAVTFTRTCPTAKSRTANFSAGTSLVLFQQNDTGQTVTYTYER